MSDPTPDFPRLDIDWVKTLAGALAAVTTAVLLSTLGAVGTLIGAALGSVAATVGSALYAQGLARSRTAVRRASESARLRLSPEAEAREQPRPWSERLRGLPWRRVALVAGATFAVVVVALTAFEAVAGRSVSSYTGGSGRDQGTTLGGVTGNSGGGRHHQSPEQQPTKGPSGSATPSEEPSASEEPSDEPTPTPTPSTPEEPTPTPTPTPSPTGSPTATPTAPSSSPTP
ncbi:hypothetical protein [Nocardioides anomalus]|uniref:hypothetical protein n=1 Tax=Nocardioides anomalus TaxID=2712223 RepID=UPI0018AD5384|nr:hypothetical protein [Nocardioides anomalus]